jgi:cytochrome c oxidase cbb3-type subunit 2
MRREPLDFHRNSGDIDSKANHGLMSAADISNGAWEEIMYGIVRCSFTIVASLLVAVPAGECALGQVPEGGAFAATHGSVIVTEDGNGTIWRVTYRGGAGTASGAGKSVQADYDAVKGRDLYIANCSACHQVSGEGLPGVFPPLKGSGVVNKDDAVKHIQLVLNGMQGARAGGVVYAAAMPPFAGVLSDAAIADIIDYERSSWGNHGKPVTAAQVAGERARPK